MPEARLRKTRAAYRASDPARERFVRAGILTPISCDLEARRQAMPAAATFPMPKRYLIRDPAVQPAPEDFSADIPWTDPWTDHYAPIGDGGPRFDLVQRMMIGVIIVCAAAAAAVPFLWWLVR